MMLTFSIIITSLSISTKRMSAKSKERVLTLPNISEVRRGNTFTKSVTLSVGDILYIRIPSLEEEDSFGIPHFYKSQTGYVGLEDGDFYQTYFDACWQNLDLTSDNPYSPYSTDKIEALKAMPSSKKNQYTLCYFDDSARKVAEITIYIKSNSKQIMEKHSLVLLNDNRLGLKLYFNVAGCTIKYKYNDKKTKKYTLKTDKKTATFAPKGLKKGDRLKIQVSKKGYKTKTITIKI